LITCGIILLKKQSGRKCFLPKGCIRLFVKVSENAGRMITHQAVYQREERR